MGCICRLGFKVRCYFMDGRSKRDECPSITLAEMKSHPLTPFTELFPPAKASSTPDQISRRKAVLEKLRHRNGVVDVEMMVVGEKPMQVFKASLNPFRRK